MKRSNYPFLNPAVKAARQAGEYILHHEGKVKEIIDKDYLSTYNPATNIDVEAENIIIDTLSDAYPSHNFLCEERGEIINDPKSPYLWIIDPLDGTSNFRYSIPFYSTSIALYNTETKNIEIGVVYTPNLNRLYTAVKDVGVECNNTRIRINNRDKLENSMTIVSMKSTHMLDTLFKNKMHLVSFKACSLDMCLIAQGQGDIFLIPDEGIQAWDVAAAALIIKEAGGCVFHIDGTAYDMFSSRPLVCGNRKLVNALLQELNK